MSPFLQKIALDTSHSLYVLRLDQYTHSLYPTPFIQGNKHFKLKYNLAAAKAQGYKQILTFGGAYSNHILATAAAAQAQDLHAIGVIRGEEHLPLNPVLAQAQACGMQLFYLNRSAYRDKNNPLIIKELQARFGDFYLLPEGGSNNLAVKGCTEIWDLIDLPCDYLCTAVGTGGTMAGLIAGNHAQTEVIGFSSLKGGSFLYDDIEKLLEDYKTTLTKKQPTSHWSLQLDYHFGGYAKSKPELLAFIRTFQTETNIPLERIYTAKMLYGVMDLIQKGFFKKDSTIVAVHTGGIFNLS